MASENTLRIVKINSTSFRLGLYLQPLDDVAVVSGSGEHGVPAGGVAGGEPPVHGCFLHDVVGLQEEVVDLAVQVNGDGYGPALGCKTDG